MKLEVGRFYKSGVGGKVEIVAKRGGRYSGYSENERNFYRYDLYGRSEAFVSNLIEEWQEPVVLKKDINIYREKAIIFDQNITELDKERGVDAILDVRIDLSKPIGQRIWEISNE